MAKWLKSYSRSLFFLLPSIEFVKLLYIHKHYRYESFSSLLAIRTCFSVLFYFYFFFTHVPTSFSLFPNSASGTKMFRNTK